MRVTYVIETAFTGPEMKSILLQLRGAWIPALAAGAASPQ
jgi:hypothetical protein